MCKKRILGNLVLAVILGAALGFCVLPCFAEDITITTYYPSPVGIYRQLVTHTLGVGDTDEDGDIDGDDAPDPDTSEIKLDVAGSVYFEGGDGDATGDGNFNIADSMFVAQYLAGTRDFTREQLAEADMNGDGKVDWDDLTISSRINMGDSKYEVLRKMGNVYGVYSGDGIAYNLIVNSGNVGIGTADPAAKLDVVGNIKVDGTINGIPFGQYVGHTGGSQYMGDMGGYTGAKANCDAVFPGSHLCTATELSLSAQEGIFTRAGLLPYDSFYRYSTGVSVPAAVVMTDCMGWTCSTAACFGSSWFKSATSFYPAQTNCDAAEPLLCCK